MKYVKQNFKNGTTLSAEHLNYIENGIEKLSEEAEKLAEEVENGNGVKVFYTPTLFEAMNILYSDEAMTIRPSNEEVKNAYLNGAKIYSDFGGEKAYFTPIGATSFYSADSPNAATALVAFAGETPALFVSSEYEI